MREEGIEKKIQIKTENQNENDVRDLSEKERPLDKLKKSELIEKIQSIQEDSDKNHDLFIRSQAEIENLKKRFRKDKEDWVKYSNETLIKELLPVIDNLEMAISHSQNENSLSALREGIELTLKGLKDAMAKSGLKEVEARGEAFDPSSHEAVSELEDEKIEAGMVLQELQKGYMLHQRLIRPSMVVVSKGSADSISDHDL
ncbi:MAG: nucleotide exchange factor GrpE, partial [Deltaproteobacteria bacterium]|nr:nucleotide exchange factor GrpE [Deltaproteobacteria bacterium]